MIRGYARVSTQDQDLAAQLEALKANGAEVIYQEKVSGAKSDRPELARLMRDLAAGEVLLVTRLDRLARSTLDLLTVLKTVGERGATFKSLADHWCDTTTPHGRLMLTVLGGLAEFERELIRARTMEGRARAKAAGKRCGGPKPKMAPEAQAEARQRLVQGERPADLAAVYGVSKSTIKRLKAA